ncbi:MAG: hypothetical protein E6J87_23360 [Deltaproteobacteria bacterium]|nr:MAG: hypothetical protein E6J87_23360 [Deltaproteobacteria bacterium]
MSALPHSAGDLFGSGNAAAWIVVPPVETPPIDHALSGRMASSTATPASQILVRDFISPSRAHHGMI